MKTVHKQFDFQVADHEMRPFITDAGDWIARHLPSGKEEEALLFRCGLILSELITNAIKHSLIGEIILDITMDLHGIEIKRIDHGKRFFLINENQAEYYPLNDTQKGQQITVFKDNMYGLFALVKNPFLIEFQLEEYVNAIPEIKDLLEHFGLIILTKSSSRFTYAFDPDTHTNVFAVWVKYDDFC